MQNNNKLDFVKDNFRLISTSREVINYEETTISCLKVVLINYVAFQNEFCIDLESLRKCGQKWGGC